MMRSLEMTGSFPLSDEVIDDTLMRTAPGNYALGLNCAWYANILMTLTNS